MLPGVSGGEPVGRQLDPQIVTALTRKHGGLGAGQQMMVVALARTANATRGRKMRADGTVVETEVLDAETHRPPIDDVIADIYEDGLAQGATDRVPVTEP